jgi:hypothetical protein
MKTQHFRKLTTTLLMTGLLLQSTTTIAPKWWSAQNVFVPDQPTDDYTALNQEQLKNFVRAAMEEINAKLPNGTNTTLNNLMAD